ncbi:MAG: hypothetical protein AVDCRST_MAG47-486 [uncultured Nocardioidaceae bacterium]|uniref:GTP-binding protein LepA n=1 Tax=uncultured Nocardioidaceae bacterium TaxID=253824 RepID=A0A6J4MUH6_9ACTN|nr:MAG: hypothetical protein AVDCRST_MAG47-486 [uncultured Nocardioidaceae bacterium]
MSTSFAVETHRLRDHVNRLEAEHPPLDPASVDYTVRRPALVLERFGRVLDYMARAELEVERNAQELNILLPHPPEIDRYFYAEVWQPQEAMHGVILDELQVRLGSRPAQANLDTVSVKVKVLGAIAHLEPVQDVIRMLYYLTGMTTERSALLAYHRLHDGLVEMGERAAADTIITPIRRQEPGHYAYYRMSADALWQQLTSWQRWLVQRLRSVSFAPVAANSPSQLADVGDMMVQLGINDSNEAVEFAEQTSRVERDLLWAQEKGMRVPPYIAKSFSDALVLSQQRS